MELLFKRPLVVFCISMVTGIIVSDITGSILFIGSLLFLLAAILYTAAAGFKGRLYICIGIFVFFAAGAFEYYFINRSICENFRSYDGVYVNFHGTIASEADIKANRISWLVDVSEIETDGKPKGKRGRILLSTANDGKSRLLEYGREISFEGTLRLPSGIRNPGGFDYKKYLARKGASAVVFVQRENITEEKGMHYSLILSSGMRVRDSIADVIERSLPAQQAGLLNGMLIGYTEGLSEEVRTAFSNAGLSHIMAVSGANVVFIIIPVMFLLKLLRVGPRVSNLLIILFLLFFICITGFEPSVLRAVVMAITILTGQMIRREGDIYTSIAFSAIFLLAVSPHMLFNIGFQLSYAATLSLVLFGKPVREMLTCRFIPGKIADILAATIAAQAGVLPITAVYFNKLSVISLFSNLLVVPLLEIITILGMAMAIVGHICIGLSQLIGYVNCGLLSFILYATGVSSSLSFSTVPVATPGIFAVLAYYPALWFFLIYRRRHNIRIKPLHLLMAGAITSLFISIPLIVPGKLEVVFLDVGEGDSAFIRTAAGMTALIDGGGKTGEDEDRIGATVVVPFLLDMGVTRLDLVVGTHGHDDHIKGLRSVLGEIGVKKLVIPDLQRLEEYGALKEITGRKGTALEKCAYGSRIVLDGRTWLEVLSPETGFCPDKTTLNDSSIVLKLHYGKNSILFTGDISTVVEEQLLDKGLDLRADVLKVAHHGSLYSSGEEFLSAVNPAAAVISVGTNHFGHPGRQVLDRLEAYRIRVLRTDETGAVSLTGDGKTIRMHTTLLPRR